VLGADGKKASELPLPAVFTSPIRTDVVQFVHTNVAKNKRQAYARASNAGEQTSAESWGTGRAVSRIPRVGGGGTHRSGQGAFGNMCRGGRMFDPIKSWRRWHRKVNVGQKRYAVCSALAASAIPALVMARGHRISQIAEVPFVISNDAVKSISKTKQAVLLLKSLGAYEDVERVINSRRLRAGKGKMRNRRYTQRRGPLFVYKTKGTINRALRNIPGVESASVERLNLLQLAPGGHLGRFIIWTEEAFAELDNVFGTQKTASKQKHGFVLPAPKMTNADLLRILGSDEVQSQLRPAQKRPTRARIHRNPLKNLNYMLRLNPYAAVQKRAGILASQKKAKAAKKDGKKRVKGTVNKEFAKSLLAK
jgi:large subunit ribosomal protein L4e